MSRNKLDDLDMIIVLGLTGAGKSYFINRLTGMSVDSVKEGDKLASCKLPENRSFARQLIRL